MPTSIHLPKPLLVALDRKAKELRISRNRLIVQAVERELEQRDWSSELFDKLDRIDDEAASAFRESMHVVKSSRRSKAAPKL